MNKFIFPQNLQRTQAASNDNVLPQWSCYINVHGCVYATVFSGQANPGQIYRNSSEYFQEKGTSQMPIPFQNSSFLLLKRLSFKTSSKTSFPVSLATIILLFFAGSTVSPNMKIFHWYQQFSRNFFSQSLYHGLSHFWRHKLGRLSAITDWLYFPLIEILRFENENE